MNLIPLVVAVAALQLFATGCMHSQERVRAAQDSSGVSASTEPATCGTSDSLNAQARAFMLNQGLMTAAEEAEQFGVAARWRLVRAEPIDGTCALVMQRCIEMNNETFCDPLNDAYEVLGTDGTTLKLFEAIVPTPTVKVAINDAYWRDIDGSQIEDDNYYYAELSGPSAIAAWKTIRLKLPMNGLLAQVSGEAHGGTAHPDGAAAFDPTPGRTWKLNRATWSLRRGSTAEAMDVPSRFFDEDFSAYFLGSGGDIGPWSAFLIRYFDESASIWKDTGIKEIVRPLLP